MKKTNNSNKHLTGFSIVYDKAITMIAECESPAHLKTLTEVLEKVQKGQMLAEGKINPLEETKTKLDTIFEFLQRGMSEGGTEYDE